MMVDDMGRRNYDDDDARQHTTTCNK